MVFYNKREKERNLDMKTENSLGEVTFDNVLQLRELMKQAWLMGKVEQAGQSLDKEREAYRKLARTLGIKLREPANPDAPMSFESWFLEFVKSLEIK